MYGTPYVERELNIERNKMSKAWKKFTNAMSIKRTGKKTNKPNNISASILKNGTITVQAF